MTAFGPEAIRGIVPPMTTPFSAAGAIDEAAFRAQARFLLEAGRPRPRGGGQHRDRGAS